jgi:cation diffusion facilitator family transporter
VTDGRAGTAARPEAESARTVVIALLANLGVALAKLGAAVVSGSAAVLAEAFHAFADAGNEILLVVAQRRSSRPPDDQHPVGYGREAYFWALIASIGVFITGAVLSVGEGIRSLLVPSDASDFALSYAVLGIALVLEALSLRRAYRQLHDEASSLSRPLVEHAVKTSDPTVRAVFGEDVAAVAGNAIAIVGVALHQVTGVAAIDAVTAIVIGLLVGAVGLVLADRNRDFLVGEPAAQDLHGRVGDVVAAVPGIVAVTELLVTFVGPRRLWVAARVDIDDTLTGADVERLTREVEARVREFSPAIVRVDVVASGPSTDAVRDHDAEGTRPTS